MSIKIKTKIAPHQKHHTGMKLASCERLRPIKILNITELNPNSRNIGRKSKLNKICKIGDICVCIADEYNYRIFHIEHKRLLPQYAADYLLFEYAYKISSVSFTH